MRKVIKYWRENIAPNMGENNDDPSLTVPDEALTVQQILLNFTRGTLPDVSKKPQYADEEYNNHLLDEDSPLDDSINDLSYIDDSQSRIASLLDSQTMANNQKEEERRASSDENVIDSSSGLTEPDGD